MTWVSQLEDKILAFFLVLTDEIKLRVCSHGWTASFLLPPAGFTHHMTVLVSRAISVSYISQRLKGKEKKRSSDIISWKQPGSRPRSVTLVWRAEQNVPFNGQTGTKGTNLKRLNHECLLLFSRGGTISERSERTELFLVYVCSFSENVMSREQVWPWNRGARQSELPSRLKLQCPQMSDGLLGVEWSMSASAE